MDLRANFIFKLMVLVIFYNLKNWKILPGTWNVFVNSAWSTIGSEYW